MKPRLWIYGHIKGSCCVQSRQGLAPAKEMAPLVVPLLGGAVALCRAETRLQSKPWETGGHLAFRRHSEVPGARGTPSCFSHPWARLWGLRRCPGHCLEPLVPVGKPHCVLRRQEESGELLGPLCPESCLLPGQTPLMLSGEL